MRNALVVGFCALTLCACQQQERGPNPREVQAQADAQEVLAFADSVVDASIHAWYEGRLQRYQEQLEATVRAIPNIDDGRARSVDLNSYMRGRVNVDLLSEGCLRTSPPDSWPESKKRQAREARDLACKGYRMRESEPELVPEIEEAYDRLIAAEINAIIAVFVRHLPEIRAFRQACEGNYEGCGFRGAPMTPMNMRGVAGLRNLRGVVGELDTPEAEEARKLGIAAANWEYLKSQKNILTAGARNELAARRRMQRMQEDFARNLELSRQIVREKRSRTGVERESVRREICERLGIAQADCRR